MITWLILFANIVLGQVYVTEPFSDYVASQSESFNIPLSTHFSGPNLAYSISSTYNHTWKANIVDPFNLTIEAQNYLYGNASATNLSNNLRLRNYYDPYRDQNSTLTFYGNSITSYYISDNKTLITQWTANIYTNGTNAFILDIAYNQYQETIYAIVGYSLNGKQTTSVYRADLNYTPYFYAVSGFSLKGGNSFRIEVSSYYVAILSAESGSPSKGSVSLYYDTWYSQAYFIATSYYTIFPVDLRFWDYDILVVADYHLGLQLYDVSSYSLNLTDEISLDLITSLDIQNSTAILTVNSSALLVDLEEFEINDVVGIYDLDGKSYGNATKAILAGRFAYVNYLAYNETSLALIDLHQRKPVQVTDWNLHYYFYDINKFAPATAFLNSDGTNSYIRVDYRQVTLALVTVGDWTLTGFTNSNDFNATVTAYVKGNPQSSASLPLLGYSFSSYSVVNANSHTFVSNNIPIYRNSSSQSIYAEIDINQYVEGNDLSFFNASYSTNPSLSLYVDIDFPEKCNVTWLGYTNLTTLYSDGYYSVGSDGQTVTAYYYSLDYVLLSYKPYFPVTSVLTVNGTAVSYSASGDVLEFCSQTMARCPGYVVLDQDCLQFKAYKGYVYCGDSKSIAIYRPYYNEFFYNYTITANTLGRYSLNFIDFSFGTGSSGSASKDFLFIIDASGVLSVDLSTFTLTGSFGSSSNVTQGLTIGDLFIVAKYGGDVDIYQVNYASLPTLTKSLPGREYNYFYAFTSSYTGLLAIQYDYTTDVIDLYADALSAVYTSVSSPYESLSSIFLRDSIIRIIPGYYSNNALISTKIIGSRPSPQAPISYPVSIYVYSYTPFNSTNTTLISGYIIVGNYNSSTYLSFQVSVSSNSPAEITTNFHQSNTSVPYYQDRIIPLFSNFTGQDVQLSLNINGGYINPYNTNITEPITLNPKVRQPESTFHVENLVDVSNYRGSNYTFALGYRTIYFLNANTSQNITVLKTIDLSNYTVAFRSFEVNSVGDNVYVFSINGTYSNFTSGQRALITVLSTLYYDEVSIRTHDEEVQFIKTVSLNNNSFVLFQAVKSPYYYYQNYVNATFFNYSNGYLKSTPISSSLGYGWTQAINFSPWSTDIAIVYFADSYYGIQSYEVYVNYTGGVTFYYLGSRYTDPLVPVSIGVCGEYLFVGGDSGNIYQYNITYATPYFTRSFNGSESYYGANGNIECDSSTYPSFAAVPQESTYSDSILILSLKSDNSSYIYANIPIYFRTFAYLDHNIVRVLSGGYLGDFVISKPYLEISELSYEEYQSILNRYGTDTFDVFITASNENYSLNTSSFTLRRGYYNQTTSVQPIS